MTLKLSLTRKAIPTLIDRVTIFLGANGTGKSTMLRDIRNQLVNSKSHEVIFVEGGRVIQLNDNLGHWGGPGRQDTLTSLQEQYNNQKTEALSSRINTVIKLLEKKGETIRHKHSDQIDSWIRNGKLGTPPDRSLLPLDRVFMLFSEIFPQITITYDLESKTLSSRKHGSQPYSLSMLSDGERQVLSILADLSVLSDYKGVIIVDEPELNLNTMLAVRLWSTLEDELKDATFVYATHNVGFCMRESVQKLYTLTESEERILELGDVAGISAAEMQTFLGMVPFIVTTGAALLTEGKHDSFDPIFYRWILGSDATQIVPMGSAADVLAVSNRQGVWSTLAPSIQIKGVIDRDFKSSQTLQSCSSVNSIVLGFHEAESYLCIPDIVKKVADSLGLVSAPVELQTVKNVIIREFNDNKLKIICQRVSEQTTLRLGVSVNRQVFTTIKNEQELEDVLIRESENQVSHATKALTPESIKGLVKEEKKLVETASMNVDLMEMLRLCPGKELLQKIFPLTGARTAIDYVRACTKHVDMEEMSALTSLRDALK